MINPLATTGIDAVDNELFEIIREAQHRERERLDPTYRRPSQWAERLADLEQYREHRRIVAAARQGDQTALRTLAAQRLEMDGLIAARRRANAATEKAIRDEPDDDVETEEEDLEW